MKRQQKQVTISAYDMEVIQKSFINTLRWLEFYVEKSGYSNNWQRQIPEPIKRQDLNNQPSEIKGFMETALLALDGMIEDKPDFILENLQEQFYAWLDKSGIKSDNCPKELNECLINVHKVLTNDGKEFVERVDREASEDIAKMTLTERRQKFYQTFTLAQRFMDGARARKKGLEGKTYKDVEIKNRFLGSHEEGKKIFSQIKGSSASQPKSLIEKIRQNPSEWSIKEVITFKGYWNGMGEIKKLALVHKDANLKNYDWRDCLRVDPQLIHFAEENQEEWFQIEQVLNNGSQTGEMEGIESSSSPAIRQTIINDINQGVSFKELRVNFQGTNNYEDWMIHDSVNVGRFISFDPNTMYKVKDLTEDEKQLIGYKGYKSEQKLQTFSASTIQNKDNSLGTGGTLALVGAASVLTIGGAVVLKKKLGKKFKK